MAIGVFKLIAIETAMLRVEDGLKSLLLAVWSKHGQMTPSSFSISTLKGGGRRDCGTASCFQKRIVPERSEWKGNYEEKLNQKLQDVSWTSGQSLLSASHREDADCHPLSVPPVPARPPFSFLLIQLLTCRRIKSCERKHSSCSLKIPLKNSVLTQYFCVGQVFLRQGEMPWQDATEAGHFLHLTWRPIRHSDQRWASRSGRLRRAGSTQRQVQARTPGQAGSPVSSRHPPWLCGCGFLITYHPLRLCSSLKPRTASKETARVKEKMGKRAGSRARTRTTTQRGAPGVGPRRGAGAPPPSPHPTPPRLGVTDSRQPLHVNQPSSFSHSLHLVINLNTDSARTPLPRPSGQQAQQQPPQRRQPRRQEAKAKARLCAALRVIAAAPAAAGAQLPPAEPFASAAAAAGPLLRAQGHRPRSPAARPPPSPPSVSFSLPSAALLAAASAVPQAARPGPPAPRPLRPVPLPPAGCLHVFAALSPAATAAAASPAAAAPAPAAAAPSPPPPSPPGPRRAECR
eukprot:bmy_21556T0